MAYNEKKKITNERYRDKFYKPQIYLPMEMKDEIKELADKEYLSVNKFLARAIMKYCKDMKEDK